MTTFKHERAESRCIDAAANRRIFWLASWEPGCLQACLSAEDTAGADAQFKRYGVLGEGEIPLGPGDDRISEVIFANGIWGRWSKRCSTVGSPILRKKSRRGCWRFSVAANGSARNC